MYFLLNMGIFHCYVSLPEGTQEKVVNLFFAKKTSGPMEKRSIFVCYSSYCGIEKKHLGVGFKHFLFSPLFGEDSHFDSYFSKGLVQPPTRKKTFFFLGGGPRNFWIKKRKQCGEPPFSQAKKGGQF